ncbi:FAD-binding domain-containing protein [Acephala macrosclerotiorum]|nr:FAD-binding domain-containing protein [Acephala macrosclerotiorum]
MCPHPTSAEQVSCAVKFLVKFQTPFAMRGGGHMPIADAANINSTGILISSTNLNTLSLSDDLSYVEVGPGPRWGDVYEYLNSTGTGEMVVGGRYAPVGVPGLLLGGEMSFFSYDYGLLPPTQCVLANGTIVNATPNGTHFDLSWALQGSGNSFCLVTKFTLRTFDALAIGLANPSYGFGNDIKTDWLTSIYNYVQNDSSDGKAAIIPVARFGPNFTSPRYDATLIYNSATESIPAILSDFQASIEAMNIVHDTFFDAVVKYDLGSLEGFFAGLAWNSITTKFIETSSAGIGCPQGVPEEPVFWVEETLTWGSAEDTPLIDEFIATMNANITAQLEAINATSAYIYLNNADKIQNVFAGYPAANVERMKAIRDVYDPDLVFTNLMPGGFKVAKA